MAGLEPIRVTFDDILDEYQETTQTVPDTPRQLFFYARKQGYDVRYKPMKAYFAFPLQAKPREPRDDFKPLTKEDYDNLLRQYVDSRKADPSDPNDVLNYCAQNNLQPDFQLIKSIFEKFGQKVPKKVEQQFRFGRYDKPLPMLRGKKWRPNTIGEAELQQELAKRKSAPIKPLPMLRGKKRRGNETSLTPDTASYQDQPEPTMGRPGLKNSASAGATPAGARKSTSDLETTVIKDPSNTNYNYGNGPLSMGGVTTFTFSFTAYKPTQAVVKSLTDEDLVSEMVMDAIEYHRETKQANPENANALHEFANQEGYDMTLQEIEPVFAKCMAKFPKEIPKRSESDAASVFPPVQNKEAPSLSAISASTTSEPKVSVVSNTTEATNLERSPSDASTGNGNEPAPAGAGAKQSVASSQDNDDDRRDTTQTDATVTTAAGDATVRASKDTSS